MLELLEFIAKRIVTQPEKVEVSQETDEWGEVVLRLKVASEDMGRVIGKQGKIIKALRQLVKVAAIKENKRVQVELVETDQKPVDNSAPGETAETQEETGEEKALKEGKRQE